MIDVSRPPEYASTTFSRMTFPHIDLLVFAYNLILRLRLAALRSGFRQEASARPLCRIARASLRLNFLTHDCSLWMRCACRCPGASARSLFEYAYGFPPGRTRSTAENQSR